MRPYVKSIVVALVAAAVTAAFIALRQGVAPDEAKLLQIVAGKLWHLGLFLFFWFAAYVVGRGAVAALFRRSWSPPPEIAAAGGILVFVLAAVILCSVHLAYGWLVKILIVAAVVAGAVVWRKEWARVPARLKRWLAELEVSTAVLVAAAAALVLPMALTAAHPPTYVDALVYHLAVPKAYAGAHGFVYLPWNVFASMPMGGSLFYLWPYLWDGLITANASHLVATLLAVSLTYRLARRWLAQFYAALAGVAVILTPVIFKVIGGAHNDHFLVLFVVAALFTYFDAGASERAARRRRYLAVGVFLGAALAVKYSAVVVLPAFVVILIYDLLKKRIRPGDVGLILAAAFVVVLPWLIKAYVERGNPVFPVAYGVFGGRDFSAEQARRLVAWQAGMGRGRGLWDYVLLPYRISIEGGFTYDYFAGRYLPFLLPLALLAAAFFRKGGRLVAFAWVSLAAWAFGPQQLRFLDGAVPAFAIAAAGTLAAADNLWASWARGIWRAAAGIAVVAFAIPFLIPAIFSSFPRQAYLASEDQEGFLRRWAAFYLPQEFINEELPPDAKVLLLYYNETLYLERDAAYDSFPEASALLLAAEEGRSEAELYDLIRGWGVTHVHAYYYGEPRLAGAYSKEALARVRSTVALHGVVVYEDNYGKVYELIPATE